MLVEVQPFDGAHELLAELKRRGFRLVLASSGKASQVEHCLDPIDGRKLADAWTTSDDVEQTKLPPDLIEVAVGKVEGASATPPGTSSPPASSPSPAWRCAPGAFSTEELHEADAAGVYNNLTQLLADLDSGPLNAPTAP